MSINFITVQCLGETLKMCYTKMIRYAKVPNPSEEHQTSTLWSKGWSICRSQGSHHPQKDNELLLSWATSLLNTRAITISCKIITFIGAETLFQRAFQCLTLLLNIFLLPIRCNSHLRQSLNNSGMMWSSSSCGCIIITSTCRDLRQPSKVTGS